MSTEIKGTKSLKEQLAKELKEDKPAGTKEKRDVELTADNPVFSMKSTDMGGGSGAEASISEPTTGDVDVEVPDEAQTDGDPLIASAEGAEGTGKRLSNDASMSSDGTKLFDSLFEKAEMRVVLTQEDRDAFLQSIITGERYKRPFSIFNGAVTGVLRCRSMKESEGIAAWMNVGLRTARYQTQMVYSAELRDALFVAQVEKLQDVEFPEMSGPLSPTAGEDIKTWTDVVPPGWVSATAVWREMPEAVVSGLFDELRTFERKYWTMITHAQDQNFWNPAVSS